MMSPKNNKPVLGNGVHHDGARPLEVHVDGKGNWWLCDKGTDGNGNFANQGCWNYSEMPFDRND
jgi:hypothetical protein